ncbi:MAG: polysaccharide chain length determinant protein (PEP-CTERM system associated) [Porticoccus sp.]|jgi:polysaccharide chain length determinant protein (PEP-CTERM system associated)|uniref:XrtA system polysaccharide chain length determinant n=1 Tax=Porticoccus sp. TaxID=2024853 RepID=UPI0039E5C7E1
MQEMLAMLFSYLSGLWRFRWAALVIAWLVGVVGWFSVSQVPDQYMATARIHVDTNTILRPLLRGLVIQPDIDQRVELMSRTLLSRPNLEKLLRMTDMDLRAQTEREKEKLFANIRRAVSLSGDRRNSSLYSVSFYHEDRDLARKVVQALITVFIESAVNEKRGDSNSAQTFLDKQIAEYEKRLVEAESALADFKQRHAGNLPGEGGGYYQRLVASQQQLSEARLQRSEMQNRRDELKRQLAGEQPVFLASGASEQSSSIDGRISSLKARLDELLSKYTDRHPEVVQINNLLESLEQERESELAKLATGEASDLSGMNTSPVYQQMRSMLAEAEAKVAELNVRVAEYQRRVDKLNSMVDKIPLVEAELVQLTRDYEVLSQQHTGLLERRESARISEDVEQQANDLVFKVIDPPFVPSRPNKPNKILLNTGVLVASLGVGAGLALLLSLLRPVISDRRRLTMVTGLPVLGCVMHIPTPAQQRMAKMNKILFVVLLLSLVAVYAGVTFLEQLALT